MAGRDGEQFAPSTYTGTLFRLAGTPCNAVPFPPVGSPGGATGTAVGTATFTFSDLAAAAGTCTGVSGHISGARRATFTLNSDDSLVRHNEGCTFNGNVTPRKSVNVFDWTLTGNDCIFAKARLSGVMYYDEANRQVHGFAPHAGRTDQYYLIGTK